MVKVTIFGQQCIIPYSGKVWWGESLANQLFSSIWRKKVWRINRSANRLLIVCTSLDGFSLDNSPNSPNFHPTKFSRYTVFPQSILKCILCKYTCYTKL